MSGNAVFKGLGTVLVALLVPALFLSCSGKKDSGEQKSAEVEKQVEGTKEKPISYVNEEVSYGLYFDEEGTKRTLKLGKGQDEFTGYLYLMCPDYKRIASTQFRLEMPEGVTIINDKYRMDRVMSMGTFARGISERFAPCVDGPKILLHTFTFKTTMPLDNAVFTILRSVDDDFLAVAECNEGYPLIRASAFKAVVNPSD
jgi:hypothetical protein